MTNSSSTDFTADDGRRFGTQVGLAFLVLGAILLWRGHSTPAAAAGGVSVGLVLAALVRPAALGPVYRKWMALALVISRVTNPIFLGIVYYCVLTPTGLVMRAIGHKPIVHEPDADDSYWIHREHTRTRDMRRQF